MLSNTETTCIIIVLTYRNKKEEKMAEKRKDHIFF